MPSNQTTPRTILVVGGGPAGVAAAVVAAGCGAQVVLIEATRRLGGSVTAAMHRSLCGLYAERPADPLDTLNDSFQRDIVRRMIENSRDSVQTRQLGKAWVLEFTTAVWEACLGEACAAPAITLMRGTRVTAIERIGDRLTAIRTDNRRAERLTPDAVIDCTGGGQLLQLCGDDIALPPDAPAARMLGGYSVRCGAIAGDLEPLRLLVPYTLAVAVKNGDLPAVARATVFSPTADAGGGVCKLAMPADTFTPSQASDYAACIVDHLRRNLDAFKNAVVIEHSPWVLPRDGLRLRGRYVMTEEDVLTGRQPGHGGVRAWWPAECWSTDAGPTYEYPPAGVPYEIPDGALRSAVITNLLAAGNAVSATAGAAASIRASGICLATGARAGELAANSL